MWLASRDERVQRRVSCCTVANTHTSRVQINEKLKKPGRRAPTRPRPPTRGARPRDVCVQIFIVIIHSQRRPRRGRATGNRRVRAAPCPYPTRCHSSARPVYQYGFTWFATPRDPIVAAPSHVRPLRMNAEAGSRHVETRRRFHSRLREQSSSHPVCKVLVPCDGGAARKGHRATRTTRPPPPPSQASAAHQ